MLSNICLLLNTKFLSSQFVAGPSFEVTNVTNRYMNFILGLDEYFDFKDRYVLTPTGITIIKNLLIACLHQERKPLKSKIFHFFWSQTWPWNGPLLLNRELYHLPKSLQLTEALHNYDNKYFRSENCDFREK